MKINIDEIKKSLQIKNAVDNDENYFSEAAKKLSSILQPKTADNCDDDERTFIDKINEAIRQNEIIKKKLLSYCMDFYDPTLQPKTIIQNGEEMQLNAFLRQDDLCKLYQFVERHKFDKNFGLTVYAVLDRHNLTAPQVYKKAMLSRQDFSRAVAVDNQNVSNRLAWQIIIGLCCSLEEASEVMFSAGYVIRDTPFDLIMKYFIETKNYDIMAINDVLYELKLKPFSCHMPVA